MQISDNASGAYTWLKLDGAGIARLYKLSVGRVLAVKLVLRYLIIILNGYRAHFNEVLFGLLKESGGRFYLLTLGLFSLIKAPLQC